MIEGAWGRAAAQLTNDGSELHLRFRGLHFVGGDFDGLEAQSVQEARECGVGLTADGELCACTMRFVIPTALLKGEALWLDCTLVLGKPSPRGGIDEERLQIRASTRARQYTSPGTSGWFEDELAACTAALGPMKNCFGCGLSDYHPVGNGLFGHLGCFRAQAAAYRLVESKSQLFELWQATTPKVQETWLCEAFEARSPGSGYRG